MGRCPEEEALRRDRGTATGPMETTHSARISGQAVTMPISSCSIPGRLCLRSMFEPRYNGAKIGPTLGGHSGDHVDRRRGDQFAGSELEPFTPLRSRPPHILTIRFIRKPRTNMRVIDTTNMRSIVLPKDELCCGEMYVTPPHLSHLAASALISLPQNLQ